MPVSSEANNKTPFISVIQGELCNNHNYKLRVFGFEPKPPLPFCRFAMLKMQVDSPHSFPHLFLMERDIKNAVCFSVFLIPPVSLHYKWKFSNPGQTGYKEKGVWSVQSFWSSHRMAMWVSYSFFGWRGMSCPLMALLLPRILCYFWHCS